MLHVGAASGDMGAAIRRFPQGPGYFVHPQDHRISRGGGAEGGGRRAPICCFVQRASISCSARAPVSLPELSASSICSRASWGIAPSGAGRIHLERGPLVHHFLPKMRWLFRWHDITINGRQISVRADFKRDEYRRLWRSGRAWGGAEVRVHRPWSRLSLVAPV